MTATSIQRSIKFKAKLEQSLSDYSSVRDTLAIISQDVNEAFHWYDINEELKNSLTADAKAKNQAPPFPSVAPGVAALEVIPTEKLTSFVGTKDSLYLTTLSHQRTVVDSPESDQAKVGYYLKDVKSIHDGSDVKGLIRRESLLLDDDVTKGGKEMVLLEHVKSLTFKYLGDDDKEWKDEWSSVNTTDDRLKNKFPDAVEITIETEQDKRSVKLSTMASLHSPNNDPFPPATPTSVTGTTQASTQSSVTTTTTIPKVGT